MASTLCAEPNCTSVSLQRSRRELTLDDSFHAVVADHLEQAGPLHAEAAAAHWELAARRAQRVLAFDEAALCFARAARNCARDSRRVALLLVEEGEALLLAGELEHARARFLASAKLARSVADPELLARSVLGIGAGPVAWEVPIGSDEQASLVADALDRLPADATALRSMLLARLSVAAATPETMPIARHRANEALELAQKVGRSCVDRAGPGRAERRLRGSGAHDDPA